MSSFEQKRLSSVAVEVKKSQHKYVIGTKGQNLQEILAETGVSVEVPPLDTPSDTITLRGDATKLGLALTAVYTKVSIEPVSYCGFCISPVFGVGIYRVAQNKILHRRICNISATIGLILKILEAA